MPTNERDATCLGGTEDSSRFQSYVSRCRTTDDTRVAMNFLTQTLEKYKAVFQNYRDQFNNLMISADALASNTNAQTRQQLEDQKNALFKRRDTLKQEISNYRRISDSAEKAFLEDIYHGTPQKEESPTLQDVALFSFWLGWLVMGLVLVAVRWGSPGGNFMSAVFALLILALTTVCVYALLKQVA
jgi:hypothetical protein